MLKFQFISFLTPCTFCPSIRLETRTQKYALKLYPIQMVNFDFDFLVIFILFMLDLIICHKYQRRIDSCLKYTNVIFISQFSLFIFPILEIQHNWLPTQPTCSVAVPDDFIQIFCHNVLANIKHRTKRKSKRKRGFLLAIIFAHT